MNTKYSKSYYKNTIRAVLPKGIHSQCILSGPNKGYHLYTSWYDYPAAILGYTERPLLEWFSKHVHAGETWLDVGAHYGYTAIALCREVGPQGRVFAFEPMLSTAGYLNQTRNANGFMQMTVIPIGLGIQRELSLLHLPIVRGMVDSTLESRDASESETLLACSLDELWPKINGGDAHIHGIKVDVQGMELEVLAGMSGVLRAERPKLVVELHQGVNRNDFLTLLERLGYSRQAQILEPVPGELEPQFVNDRSYAFSPLIV